MVSVDTIRAYTCADIDINYLVQNNWKIWFNKKNNTTSYYKKIKNLLFWYYPTGILIIKFSLAKYMNETNAIPFDLNYSSIAIRMLNSKIKQVFHGIPIEPFENWMCNELHPFVHFYTNNISDKIIYLDALKRTYFNRLKKKIYPTGVQARNGSHALNIYSKNDEIQYRLNKHPSTISKDDLSVLADIKNVIRFEYQKKKRSMQYTLNKHRTMKDVLNENFCKKILLDIIINNSLHFIFMEKDELIDTVKNIFSKVLANNLIEFIIDFNERDQEYLDNKYADKTQGNYLRKLKVRKYYIICYSWSWF